MPDTLILTDSGAIADFARELHAFPVIAVDLEADSMHCYKEKVCLLQFTTPERTVLVDPLTVSDLDPLKPVMADPAVRKIFHAADYDIRCLYRDFAIEINGLFDTMISCQFLGEEKFGLADILGKYYGLALDKQYQRADWALRPLTPEMIRYAAEDTRHLHGLALMLEERLAAKGRLDWVAEEFTLLEQVRHNPHQGPMFLRTKGAAALDRRQLAVLEEVLQWRDREARRRDRPPFKILGSKSLFEVARSLPRSEQGLVAIEGISPHLVERFGRALLTAVETAMALPETELPVFPRGERRLREPEVDKRMSVLKEWRQATALELGIDSGVLINNATLEGIARAVPHTAEALGAIPGIKNWQRRVLGPGILNSLGN
jgi:ribonuclease D